MLSIIIIAKNEQKLLPKLLNSIKKQAFKDYEIIVSDADSKDKTREIARKYNCRITKGGVYSVGRNNGAELAKGDYLLFLDADCILPEDFLYFNFLAFRLSEKSIATVEIKPLSDRYTDKILYKLYHYYAILISRFSPHCSGASLFIKKEVFDKVGGFDEKIVFAEDHAFARKLKRVYFLPIPIYTSVRRLDKDGRFKFVIKYIYAGLYRLFYKEIEKPLFEYDNISTD